MEKLQKQFVDLLNEISKVSAMRATTSLSKFLKFPLALDFKNVELENIQTFHYGLAPSEKTISLFSSIKGSSLSGASFLLFNEESAFTVCNLMLHKSSDSPTALNEIEESVLSEIANILIGNFLTTFTQSLLTGLLLHNPSVLKQGEGLALQPVLRQEMMECVQSENVFKVSFVFHNKNIRGLVIFIFPAEKINSLLKQLFVISNG